MLDEENEVPATCLVAVFEVPENLIGEVLEQAVREHGTESRLVFVTDDLDFLPFRQRKLVFEHLPSRAERAKHAQHVNWADYLRQRWSILAEKWQATKIVSYGLPPEEFLVTEAPHDEE